jgi:hypothetical protein
MYVGQQILLSLADLTDIHHRQQALRSLLSRRHRRLHESLDERILRAEKDGTEPDLTREEWERLHQQELVHVRGQIADLEREILYAREQGTDLRKTMARAKRLKAAQPSKSRART